MSNQRGDQPAGVDLGEKLMELIVSIAKANTDTTTEQVRLTEVQKTILHGIERANAKLYNGMVSEIVAKVIEKVKMLFEQSRSQSQANADLNAKDTSGILSLAIETKNLLTNNRCGLAAIETKVESLKERNSLLKKIRNQNIVIFILLAGLIAQMLGLIGLSVKMLIDFVSALG